MNRVHCCEKIKKSARNEIRASKLLLVSQSRGKWEMGRKLDVVEQQHCIVKAYGLREIRYITVLDGLYGEKSYQNVCILLHQT